MGAPNYDDGSIETVYGHYYGDAIVLAAIDRLLQ